MKLLLSDATKLTVSKVTPTAAQVNGNTVDALEITVENMTIAQVRTYFSGGSLLSTLNLYTDNMVLRNTYNGYEVRKSIAMGDNDGQFIVILAKTSEVNELIKGLDKAVQSIREDVNVHIDEVQKHGSDIAELQKDSADLISKMRDTQDSIKKALEAVNSVADRCTKIETSVGDLRVQIKEFTQTIQAYAKNVVESGAKTVELGNQVSDVVLTAKNAAETATDAKIKVANYDQTISFMSNTVNKLSDETVVVKEKIDVLGFETNNISKAVEQNTEEAKTLLDDKTNELKESIVNLANGQTELSNLVSAASEKTLKLEDRVTLLEPVTDYTLLTLDDAIAYRVKESAEKLELYLEQNPIMSTCHNKAGARYAITSTKQAHLQSMIAIAQTAAANNIPFQPSWNASGEECTYDWTIAELQQLALEIASVVRPLVSYQQKLEKKIKACTSMDQLVAITIDYSSVDTTSSES